MTLSDMELYEANLQNAFDNLQAAKREMHRTGQEMINKIKSELRERLEPHGK